MSHIVKIQTEVRDVAAIRAACGRLELPAPEFGEVRMFQDAQTGWAVRLRDWRYPVVCDVRSGQVHFDNFGGRWGDRAHLGRFLQSYAVEKTKLEARRRGHTATEQTLADGRVKVTVNVGDSL